MAEMTAAVKNAGYLTTLQAAVLLLQAEIDLTGGLKLGLWLESQTPVWLLAAGSSCPIHWAEAIQMAHRHMDRWTWREKETWNHTDG
ncbi:hypothetical protein NHX12_006557 [Muraenolepis orangiensis]|uniref:Uncharacterized protein n=1 Tax=Muraenolepis orangiensis TaxID=630683 RepID=A0A9Q0DV23_9TELE|nr:hypothetical protein NHX12_006557 [Muraenolepis orangiensis]